MPCYEQRSREDDGYTQYRLDRVTDLLCQAGRACYSGEPIPEAVLKWWKTHEESDARRGEPWNKTK